MRLLILLMLLPLILHAQELPKVELGVLACEDGSRWHGFSFTAQAGCAYELQSSTDLQHWTTEDSFMGWGESHPVLMKAMPQPVAAASLPAGAIPTPRPRLPVVRLLMRPATGGGLVLSWLSLDDGTPRNWCFSNFTLSVGWQVVPGYIRRFTSHEFLISSPQLAQVPPAVNPALGTRDGAMIAEFETQFPAMQAEVAALLERMVAQPFAATMPTERKFYRLVVEPEVDTDGDGTPDRLEFQQLFERAAGNFSIGGPAPDPFDGDTDGNGLADGEERSSDGDSISDGMDAAPEDERVDWRKLPPYRYALFPLPEGTPYPASAGADPAANGLPVQTCDQANVLYGSNNQLFTSGVLRTLPDPAGIVQVTGDLAVYGNCQAFALDDTGSAYGRGQVLFPADSERSQYALILWSPEGTSAAWLKKGDGYLNPVGNELHYGTHRDLFAPTLIGGERGFQGSFQRYRQLTSEDGQSYWGLEQDPHAFWKVTGVTSGSTPPTLNPTPLPLPPGHTLAPDGSAVDMPILNRTFVGGHDFETLVQRVVRLPSNELMAIKASGPPMIRKNGEWREAKSFKETVVDVSADTGFVFHKFDGKAWQNGKVLNKEQWVPGIGGLDRLEVLDAAPAGPILASYGEWLSTNAKKAVLGLPLCVEGVDTTVTPPVSGDHACGVDQTSMQATGGTAHKPEMWIMAPQGSASNTVKFLSASNPINHLKLSSPVATFSTNLSNDADPADELKTKEKLIKLKGTGVTTVDGNLDIKLTGTVGAINVPIKIKSMKRRVVKVAVHKVIGVDEHGMRTVPDMIPTEAALESALNKVYGRQTNTFFDVLPIIVEGADEPIPYDIGDQPGMNFAELKISDEFAKATPNAKSTGDNPIAHIDIWVLAGVTIYSAEKPLHGVQIGGPGVGRILINGSSGYYQMSNKGEYIKHVFAHEIGHVMTSDWHADKVDGEPLGKSFLKGMESQNWRRLMCSGGGKTPQHYGNQLIKNEWDRIEDWLKDQEAKDKLPLTP